MADARSLPAEPWAAKLIAAAEAQVGVTLSYDPAYRKLAFPGGDVPRESAFAPTSSSAPFATPLAIDLQALVNADMKRSIFSAYPKIWGLNRTDSNIDHRRVPNLRVWFKRKGARVPVYA